MGRNVGPLKKKAPYTANSPNRPLSAREKRVVSSLAKGYSKKRALALAGYTGSAAYSQIMRRPVVQSALTDALAKQGISLAKIVRPIGDALKATLHSSFMGKLSPSTLPDHKTRLEAAELGISLHGGLPKQVELPPAPQEPLTVVIESPDGSRVGLRIGVGPGPGLGQQDTPRRRPTVKERQAEELKIILDGVPEP